MTSPSLISKDRLSVSMPIGGGLRRVVELSRDEIEPLLIIANHERLPSAASYQAVGDKLLQGSEWSSRRVFVTSPGDGEGKTCTAFNLAWALSVRKKSVLLVELNFARPQFRRVLGNLQVRYGIDSAMRGTVEPPESVFSIGTEGVSVAPVRNATSTRDLKHYLTELTSFLEWGNKHYDWVILDCPPVLSREWNSWFRQSATESLMVIREQRTSIMQVRKATKRLAGSLKAVLLNDAVSEEPNVG